MEIEGVDGFASGTTESGALRLLRLSGAIKLETKRGDVTLQQSYVRGTVDTNDGRALMEDVSGDVQGTTSKGASSRHASSGHYRAVARRTYTFARNRRLGWVGSASAAPSSSPIRRDRCSRRRRQLVVPQIAQTLFNWVICLSVAVPLPAIVISYTRLLTQKLDQIERLLIGPRAAKFNRAFGYNLLDVLEPPPAEVKTPARAKSRLFGNGNGSNERPNGERRNDDFQSTFRAYYNWYSYALGLAFVAVVAVTFAVAALARLGLSFDPLPSDVQHLLAEVPTRALGGGGRVPVRRVRRGETYRTVDLYPSVLHYLWVRILVAAFVGYVVGAPSKEPADVRAAFAVGVFPLGDLWAWLRTRVDIGGRHETDDRPSLRLIQGLEREESRDRLDDEGISSVQQLAYADPVGLLFRTNLEWNVILDLIDQAILALYVGESIDKLRPPGIRSAVEFPTIDSRLNGGNPSEVAIANQIITSTAERLEMTEPEVRNIAFQLNNDPVVGFIWDHWTATVSTTHGETSVGTRAGTGAGRRAADYRAADGARTGMTGEKSA